MIVCKSHSGLNPLTERHYEELAKGIESKQDTIHKADIQELKQRLEDLKDRQLDLELSIIMSKPSEQRTPEERELLYRLTLEALTPNQ